jgi:hypothetical protein
MARTANKTTTVKVGVTVSVQTKAVLDRLSALGIYGCNAGEVARHFVRIGIDDLIGSGRIEKLEGFIRSSE